MDVPPVAAAYQLIVATIAPLIVAVKVAVFPEQIVAFVAEIVSTRIIA